MPDVVGASNRRRPGTGSGRPAAWPPRAVQCDTGPRWAGVTAAAQVCVERDRIGSIPRPRRSFHRGRLVFSASATSAPPCLGRRRCCPAGASGFAPKVVGKVRIAQPRSDQRLVAVLVFRSPEQLVYLAIEVREITLGCEGRLPAL